MTRLFSTEQVSKWHPDKYADQISDSVVALAVNKNPRARCAVETLVKDNTVYVAGEIGNVSISKDEIKSCIYKVAKKLNYQVDTIYIQVQSQSMEINHAVDVGDDVMAGDQGMMIGYATNETPTYLPLGFHIANEIIRILEALTIKDGILKGDAKTQVVIDLDTKEIDTILISVCYKEGYYLDWIREYVKSALWLEIPHPKKWLINPSGAWHVGGATADSGLTGRKIVADQYGGYVEVGGGAFSGKDLSKVDRSGAYFARNLAIDLLNLFGLEWCKIQLGYSIGVKEPISVFIDTDRKDLIEDIMSYVSTNVDLSPKSMIEHLQNLDYEKLAEGCHYRHGRV